MSFFTPFSYTWIIIVNTFKEIVGFLYLPTIDWIELKLFILLSSYEINRFRFLEHRMHKTKSYQSTFVDAEEEG